MEQTSDDWVDLSAQAALASHRLIGWMFWDPEGIERYTALGVPDGFGWYINSRGAPLLAAGHQAVTAAFATISPAFIEMCMTHALAHTTPEAIYDVRYEAVGVGLRRHVPEICDGLAALGPDLWAVADGLPSFGRVLFAAHRQMPRPDDAVVSAWCAVNTIREWRGDTHFAVLVAEDVDATTAGILDDARRNYGGWIPRSRGADDAAIAAAMDVLAERGYATDGAVNEAGLAYRKQIEERTDALTAEPWRRLGAERTRDLVELVAPVGARLVERIDVTAGPEWMPAARDITP
jgi:hypothetical protein